MDETTTAVPTESGVEASTQPADVGNEAAAPPQEPTQGQPAQADQEYAAWLQSKGMEPDSDIAHKAAQMAFNAEKRMTKAAQEASELRKSLGSQESILPQQGQDPAMQEFIQDYRRDKQINAFKDSHPDWNKHEPAMVDILSRTAPNGYSYSQLVNAGFMDLEAVYTMAKGVTPVDTEQIKSQAQQEVLQTAINMQRAGGGNAHASNSNPQAPKTDPVLEAIRRSRGS